VLVLSGVCCFQSFLFPCCLLFTYSLFTGVLGQKGLFFLIFYYLTLVSSSVCMSPLSIFCGAGLVVTNFLVFACCGRF
jgi:hypothetical protein